MLIPLAVSTAMEFPMVEDDVNLIRVFVVPATETLVPEVPLDPDVPELPEVPDEPLVPVDPLEPDVPELPDVPLDPLVPLDPDVPELPEVPDEPSAPALFVLTTPPSNVKNVELVVPDGTFKNSNVLLILRWLS